MRCGLFHQSPNLDQASVVGGRGWGGHETPAIEGDSHVGGSGREDDRAAFGLDDLARTRIDLEFSPQPQDLDRRGEPTHLLKGNNYKGCFHVPRALLFSVQRIEGAKEKPRALARGSKETQREASNTKSAETRQFKDLPH